ncbi:MAG: hypothetical protein ACR2II_11640, partial [Chthoniobacterales bacterium]
SIGDNTFDLRDGCEREIRARPTRLPTFSPIMNSHCFFAHIALATDARAHAIPQATTNLLIEIDDVA